MAFPDTILRPYLERFRNLTEEKKRQFLLLCTGAVVFILALSVIITMTTRDSGENLQEETIPYRMEDRITISSDDIFLPEEPDFLPGVLLERERRTEWTEDDALEFWHDPLRQGEEIWRIRIEEAIDEFLERIP